MKWILCMALFFATLSGQEVKVYKGTSNYNSDILATVRDGAVYDGRSSYRSDIRFTIDGPLTLGEFVAVWYSVMYGW